MKFDAIVMWLMTQLFFSRQSYACGFLLAALLLLGVSFAASDLDRTLSLAQQQYSAAAVQTVLTWRRLMDDTRGAPDLVMLNQVNTFFNRRMQFLPDTVVWGKEDYWATPLEFMGHGAGDCEDFSIAKYMTLQLMGMNKDRLRMIYVRAQTGPNTSVAHMVLGYYLHPTDEPLILDNLIGSVQPASQRIDLTPVYSFNDTGLWVGSGTPTNADPTTRLSKWRDVLNRMHHEGISP